MNLLPKNSVSPFIPLGNGVIKTIAISIPDMPMMTSAHLRINWDMGMDVRVPEMDVSDTSSPDAIIEGRNAVVCTGWSKRADTNIAVTLAAETTPQDIEQWMSEIGWAIGAGYMYRWYHGPSDVAPEWDFGGGVYTCAGMDSAVGDEQPQLAQVAKDNGYWSWEVNAAYHKSQGQSKMYWEEWYRTDISLIENGSRLEPFPGWDGSHPWLWSKSANTGYESHYFYAPTFSGSGKNKRISLKKYAVYVKGMSWAFREEVLQ